MAVSIGDIYIIKTCGVYKLHKIVYIRPGAPGYQFGFWKLGYDCIVQDIFDVKQRGPTDFRCLIPIGKLSKLEQLIYGFDGYELL